VAHATWATAAVLTWPSEGHPTLSVSCFFQFSTDAVWKTSRANRPFEDGPDCGLAGA
jgi:hypothetical protein